MILDLIDSQHVLVYQVNFSELLIMSILHNTNLSKIHKHWGSFLTYCISEVVNQYRQPTITIWPNNQSLELSYKFPVFRRLTAAQIKQMLLAIAHQAQLQ